MAARRASDGGGELGSLVRWFLLADTLAAPEAAAALAPLKLTNGLTGGLPERAPGGLRAGLDVRPSDTGAGTRWMVGDLDGELRARVTEHDHVLGVGPASLALLRVTPATPVGTVLDLGTGCGVQAVHACTRAGRVTATDRSARALALARASFALNELEVEVVGGTASLLASWVHLGGRTGAPGWRRGSHRMAWTPGWCNATSPTRRSTSARGSAPRRPVASTGRRGCAPTICFRLCWWLRRTPALTRVSVPGEHGGWEPVVQRLHRGGGPRWEHETDELGASLLAGMRRGGLPLGELVALLEVARGEPAGSLVPGAVALARDLLRHGLVVPV